jgi:hypothetical protein
LEEGSSAKDDLRTLTNRARVATAAVGSSYDHAVEQPVHQPPAFLGRQARPAAQEITVAEFIC